MAVLGLKFKNLLNPSLIMAKKTGIFSIRKKVVLS